MIAQSAASNASIDWRSDFQSAKEEAASDNKFVMLYFSGSDWCKPCIQLNKNIIETEVFSMYAKGNFVPVKLDFPKMKKNKHTKNKQVQNEELAQKYNPNGVFPLLVFLDENDKMVGFTGYTDVSPQTYVTMISRVLKK